MVNKKFVGLIGCGYWGKNLARDFNYLGVLRSIVTLTMMQKMK